MEAKTAEGERKMKKLLAVCLMALVCWVCAGYAEETRVGDTVIFGQYEQDGNLDNGSEPIAWLVLDVQGGKALLMSRYALDCLPFHDEKTDAAWNQSALNAWLQADFRAAFTDAEWAAIAPVTLADTAAEMPQNDRWFFEKQHDDFWESMADLVEVIFPTDELLELPFAPPAPDSEEKPENIAQQ